MSRIFSSGQILSHCISFPPFVNKSCQCLLPSVCNHCLCVQPVYAIEMPKALCWLFLHRLFLVCSVLKDCRDAYREFFNFCREMFSRKCLNSFFGLFLTSLEFLFCRKDVLCNSLRACKTVCGERLV